MIVEKVPNDEIGKMVCSWSDHGIFCGEESILTIHNQFGYTGFCLKHSLIFRDEIILICARETDRRCILTEK